MAAVVELEQSRSPDDLRRVVAALQRRAWKPTERRLEGVFAECVWRLATRLAPGEPPPPPAYTLEPRGREDAPGRTRERVPPQWRQEGLEQGIEQQRTLLRLQSESRFGARTADRLGRVLERIADPERLAVIGDLRVRCETADELLAGADGANAGRTPR